MDRVISDTTLTLWCVVVRTEEWCVQKVIRRYNVFGVFIGTHPGGNPGANLNSISHTCHLRVRVAFVGELTKETIYLPLGCVQIGEAWGEGSRVEDGWLTVQGQRVVCSVYRDFSLMRNSPPP